MATIDSLKLALERRVPAIPPSARRPLSDTQYDAGFEPFVQDLGWNSYEQFVIPKLSELLTSIFSSRTNCSVLEIGPGPKSILGHLPVHLKRKFGKYTAFEPNILYAARLEEWFGYPKKASSPLPCLESPPEICRDSFILGSNAKGGVHLDTSIKNERFDIILFCHSMYGMHPKSKLIEQALELLVGGPEDGLVVVFHRGVTLHLDGLVCHQTASFPSGLISVKDVDNVLDSFALFIAGFVVDDIDMDSGKSLRVEWRETCRALGSRNTAHPDHLLFSSPEVMASFTGHAVALPRLIAKVPVPVVGRDNMIKNREARLHLPASIVRPTELQHIQQCVKWALESKTGLTVIGGSHSGHCLWPNIVAVDMSAFDYVHVLSASKDVQKPDPYSDSACWIVAGAGCRTEKIVQMAMAAGVTVPLGSRPSVGAGLWLQGGIGHLVRQHGLACDAVVGAVVVDLASGQVLCIGYIPSKYQPAGAVRPENESDLLWAIKGAGTNFGIVVSVTFKTYTASTFSVRNWVLPLSNSKTHLPLKEFDNIAAKLPRSCSADAYLYWEKDQLHLGITMIESSTSQSLVEASTILGGFLGPEDSHKVVDAVGLFETEMYISKMHGGHGGGKTSSFKRCLFLRHVGQSDVADILMDAIKTRPSPFCYIHLLHGGGTVADVAADATAFGCRDWNFACVVTGVWRRDEDETEAAQAAVQWVYQVARYLLPFSEGVYGADLGPDPRDDVLAAKAFGPNRLRLASLKRIWDPYNVLAYTCPLFTTMLKPKLIILVTGESGAGKDYCAHIWVTTFITSGYGSLKACAVSISDATKREYAISTGADLERLLGDRPYKEQHRRALTRFFHDQVCQRPRLREEHFLSMVHNAIDVDVLLITGMRDEAPIARFPHLVPESRVIEVRINASRETRSARRGCHFDDDNTDDIGRNSSGEPNLAALNYRPSLIFDNDATGDNAGRSFAEDWLLPFFHEDLQRLAGMVRPVRQFPRPGIEFRHVLDIAQTQHGLNLCASLLQDHFTGHWKQVQTIACCEAGGFVFAPALASRVNLPLVLIREAGKLPPPTVSVTMSQSHISSRNGLGERRIEVAKDAIASGASVVVLDDVLASGNTLCAILQLLVKAGVRVDNIKAMVVAEFPVHRGRHLLHQQGFGGVTVQSLLVFGGT